MKRPLLDAYTTLPDGKISVVATFGNPLIWWAGIPAFFFNLYQWQVKKDERTGYLCICYLTMLVPWLFIHRTVFIYQYFVCSIVPVSYTHLVIDGGSTLPETMSIGTN